MKKFTISQLCEHVNGQPEGDLSLEIHNLAFIQDAGENELTFVGDKKYLAYWESSHASALVVDETLKPLVTCPAGKAVIFVKNADLAMAKILELFFEAQPSHQGIHASAVIDPSVKLGKNVSVGPNVFIGKNCEIGDNTIIYANVSIYDDSKIGKNCTFWSGVLIRERTEIGDYCSFHANCSIGNDGFGYRPAEDGSGIVKIPHIGNVVIGNHVEIGASTCIDRGKFSATRIGDHTKIDNLVQIGHNCVIGRGCIICGAVGMSGSIHVDDGATIAGGAGIKDHVKIGKGSVVGARSGVMYDIPDGQTHAGYPADTYANAMRQWSAVRQLPGVIKTVKRLVKIVDGKVSDSKIKDNV